MSVTGEYIAETLLEVDPFDTGLTEKWSFSALGLRALLWRWSSQTWSGLKTRGEDQFAQSAQIIEQMLTQVEGDAWKELD